jgi:hypothetical protein
LKGVIAVVLFYFLLNHWARADFDDGHRDDRAVVEKNLSHPQFSPDDSQAPFHSLLSPIPPFPSIKGRTKEFIT